MPAIVGQKNWQGEELVWIIGQDEDISADRDIEVFREGRNLRSRRITGAVACQYKRLALLGWAEKIEIDGQRVSQRRLIVRIGRCDQVLLGIHVEIGVTVIKIGLNQDDAETDHRDIAMPQHVDLFGIQRMADAVTCQVEFRSDIGKRINRVFIGPCQRVDHTVVDDAVGRSYINLRSEGCIDHVFLGQNIGKVDVFDAAAAVVSNHNRHRPLAADRLRGVGSGQPAFYAQGGMIVGVSGIESSRVGRNETG